MFRRNKLVSIRLYSKLPLAEKIIAAEREFREAFPEITDSEPLILVAENGTKNSVTLDKITNFFHHSASNEEIAENARLSEIHAKNQTY